MPIQGKNATSQSRSTRRDSLATAQTPYSSTIALPLDVCVWGDWVSKVNDDTRPDFWLCWNDEAEELQIYKDPLGELKKKYTRTVNFSQLKDCAITVSTSRTVFSTTQLKI